MFIYSITQHNILVLSQAYINAYFSVFFKVLDFDKTCIHLFDYHHLYNKYSFIKNVSYIRLTICKLLNHQKKMMS